MNKSQSITKLAEALAKAQAEMPVVRMNAVNTFLKNKYADLGAVIEASRPILAEHSLSITQFPVSTDAGMLGVTSLLLHSSGEWIEDTVSIPISDAKGLSVAQSAGVVISYLRRYAWSSILGLYADEDSDGQNGESIDENPKETKSNRQTMIDRYNELTKDAEAFSIKVNPINKKMTDDEIIEAGRFLKNQIAEKAGE